MLANELKRVFDSHWDRLAAKGICDTRGSREYDRVYRQWVTEGRTRQMVLFIYINANHIAVGRLRQEA